MKTTKELFLLCLLVLIEMEVNAATFESGGVKYYCPGNNTCEVTYLDYVNEANNRIYNPDQKYSGKIIIPSTLTYGGRQLTVTGIGAHAFENCSNLIVTIPESVTTIGDYAFQNCGSLTVYIPKSVTIIGGSAFKGCHYPNICITDILAWCKITYKDNPFYYDFNLYLNKKEVRELIIPNTVACINAYTFFGCYNLKSVTIPESVTRIGKKAFYNTRLRSVTIGGNGVLSIADDAFSHDYPEYTYYGSNPNKVIWLTNTPPEGYKNVGGDINYVANEQYELKNQIVYPFLSSIFEVEGAKYVPVSPSERTCDVIDCVYGDAAKSIHIGKTVSYRGVDMKVRQVNKMAFYWNFFVEKLIVEHDGDIDDFAFSGCSKIQTANISNKGRIGKRAFYQCSGMQVVNIYNDGDIGVEAFYECKNFENLTISNNGNIGSRAFSSSKISRKLQVTNTGNVYDGFSNIEGSFDAFVNNNVSFYGSTGLKSLELGEKATAIGEMAFKGCTQLRSVLLPNTITTIDESAFSGCSLLQSIVIPNAVTSIGSSAFSGCSSMRSAEIGNGVKIINENAFKGCSSLTDLQIGENVKSIGSEAFSGCKMLPVIRIPQSVTQIDNNAFSGCTSLKQVIMEEKKGDYSKDVLTLGSNGSNPLFASCPLDSVFIGRNISYSTSSNYGYSPFYRNASLRSVVITDRETEISPNEFYGCTNLKNVKIGDGVTTIGDWAFSGCSSLKSFAFGLSVKSIGKEAFSDCTAITSIRSRAVVPPVCGSHALDDLNKWDCTLYVPVGYVNAYMAANQWKEFFFVQEGDLVTFPVTSISLNKESVTLKVNETETLVATLLPENAIDKSVKWTSSDEAIATVDANGVVTAKKVGKAIITAVSVSNPDVTAACEVIVSQPVQSVTLNETSIFFDEIGATYQLTATVLPEDAENKSVTWASSNSAVCTISEEGLVTAIGDGTATVSVTTVDGGKTATCKVSVTIPIPVQLITLNAKTFQMSVGESEQLTATLLPFNATDRSVRWTSSNETVATVDANGIVTAQKVGKAMITATSVSNPDVTATCEVTVSQPVQSVTLNVASIVLNEIGETYQLTATVLPEDAENKSVTWTSSNPDVCSVSKDGLVMAVGSGTAKVKVFTADGSKTAICEVTVFIPVKTITLNYEALELSVGESQKLEATIFPDNATDKSLEWTSSDETIAIVDANGRVTAKKSGKATIKVLSSSVLEPVVHSANGLEIDFNEDRGLPIDLISIPDPNDVSQPYSAEEQGSLVDDEYLLQYKTKSEREKGTEVFRYESPVLKFSQPVSALCFTVLHTILRDRPRDKEINDGPYFNVSEFYLYDSDGNEISLTNTGFSSNAKEKTEGSYEGLIDGNMMTFFHSSWSSTDTQEYHNLQISLPMSMTSLKFAFEVSWNNTRLSNIPTEFLIFGMSQARFELFNAIKEAEKSTSLSYYLEGNEPGFYRGDFSAIKTLKKILFRARDVYNDEMSSDNEMDELVINLGEAVSFAENSTQFLTLNLPQIGEIYRFSNRGSVSRKQGKVKDMTVFDSNILWGADADPADEYQDFMFEKVANPLDAEENDIFFAIKNVRTGKYIGQFTDDFADFKDNSEYNWYNWGIRLSESPVPIRIMPLGKGQLHFYSLSANSAYWYGLNIWSGGGNNGDFGQIIPYSTGADGASAWYVCHQEELPLQISMETGFDEKPYHLFQPVKEITLSADKICSFRDLRISDILGNSINHSTVQIDEYSIAVTFKENIETFYICFDNTESVNTITITNGFDRPDNRIYATCEVKVVQPVESVTLSETSIVLNEIGATYQLTATVLPEDAENKSVTWASSDDKVCTVASEGLVTAVGNGTATVTVTTIDGGKYATCQVRVNIPVKSITLYSDTLLMQVGDSRQLEAIIEPENATDKNLEWSTSDSSVAKVDSSGLVEAVAEGTALITVKSVAYPDVMAMCDVTVIEDNGIMMLQVGEMLYVRAIYDVTGRKLERLQQGINILLLNDGTIKKINLKN